MANINDLDTDDNETTDAIPDTPAATSAPVASPSTSTPMNPTVQEYLQQKQKQMSDAQAQADQNSKYSGLARAGAFLAAGIAGSNQPVNQAPFDALDREAQQPVQNVLDKQRALSQNMKNISDAQDLKDTSEQNDPDSEASKRFRSTLKASFPAIAAAYGDSFDKLTAGDQADVFKVTETKAKLDEQSENAKMRNIIMHQAQEDRLGKSQTVAAQKVDSLIETSRQTPDVIQAYKDRYAIDKANALTEKYPDPNKMSGQQVNLLVQELGKVATGGTPTMHELEGLTPGTLSSKFGSVWSKLANEPTAANAGEFVKQYKQYLDDIGQTAQKTIDNKIGRVLDVNRKFMGEDNYNIRKERYAPTKIETKEAPQDTTLQDKVAAEMARRKAARQQPPVAPITTTPVQPPTSTPNSSNGSGYTGFAYGGMVGGLPESNYAASQMKAPRAPALHLQAPRRFDNGGVIPGQPKVNHNDPKNDVVPILATPKEVMLPLSITQSKDPAMAAYLYMKQLAGKR